MTELDDRYLILKRSDVTRYIPRPTLPAFKDLVKLIENSRSADGKEPWKGLVVRDTWPEYEAVKTALESRINGIPHSLCCPTAPNEASRAESLKNQIQRQNETIDQRKKTIQNQNDLIKEQHAKIALLEKHEPAFDYLLNLIGATAFDEMPPDRDTLKQNSLFSLYQIAFKKIQRFRKAFEATSPDHDHVRKDEATGEWITYDEAGLEHSRHAHRDDALLELGKYAAYLNAPKITGVQEPRSSYDRLILQRETGARMYCDPYELLHALDLRSPTLDHVIKKAWNPGGRSGGKDRLQDIKEIAWTANCALLEEQAAQQHIDPEKERKAAEKAEAYLKEEIKRVFGSQSSVCMEPLYPTVAARFHRTPKGSVDQAINDTLATKDTCKEELENFTLHTDGGSVSPSPDGTEKILEGGERVLPREGVGSGLYYFLPPLHDKTIVITGSGDASWIPGSGPIISRKWMEDLIEKLGGRVSSSVHDQCDYVIEFPSIPSADKIGKAHGRGIPVVPARVFASALRDLEKSHQEQLS